MATVYDGSVDIGRRDSTTPSFARRFFDRFVEGRQREANRKIAEYLGAMNSGTHVQTGYTSTQLQRLADQKNAR